MAPKLSPKCMECQTTESIWWSSIEADNQQICHACHEKKQLQIKNDKLVEETKIKHEQEEVDIKMNEERKLRKSTRSTRYKYKSQISAQQQATPAGAADSSAGSANANHNTSTSVTSTGNNGHNNGGGGSSKGQSKSRSRRHIFKRAPTKLIQQSTAEMHSVESVFHKGSYMQVGDIVSLMDTEGSIYYAQISGLLVDAYSEKSAYLTWLLPTTCSPDPQQSFDPSTYLIGPDEQFSRKLSCLEFVMHAPSNYFHDRTTPFPLPDAQTCSSKAGGYIWTRLTEDKNQKVSTH